MNSVRRQNPIMCIVLGSVLLCIVMGFACADSGNPSEQGRSPAGRWSRIELVDHYSFTGSVLEDTNLSGIACFREDSLWGATRAGRSMVELSRTAKTLKAVRTILPRTGQGDMEAIAAEATRIHHRLAWHPRNRASSSRTGSGFWLKVD
jgi:hypothetical protein